MTIGRLSQIATSAFARRPAKLCMSASLISSAMGSISLYCEERLMRPRLDRHRCARSLVKKGRCRASSKGLAPSGATIVISELGLHLGMWVPHQPCPPEPRRHVFWQKLFKLLAGCDDFGVGISRLNRRDGYGTRDSGAD